MTISENYVTPNDMLARWRAEVEEVIDLYRQCYLRDPDVTKASSDLRRRIGITVGRMGDHVVATSGAIDVMTNLIGGNRLKQNKVEELIDEARASISQGIDTATLATLRNAEEGRILPFRIATAIDRHHGFLRRALPSLRSTARHILLADRILLATWGDGEDLEHGSLKCIHAFRRVDYLRRGQVPDGAMMSGNLVMLKTPTIDSGVIRIPGALPGSTLAAMVGRPLDEVLTGRGWKGIGLTIREATLSAPDEVTLHTDAMEEEKLVPVDLAKT